MIEYLDHVGGMGIDMEISKQFQKVLIKQGLNFKVNTKVVSSELKDNEIIVATESVKDGKVDKVGSVAMI